MKGSALATILGAALALIAASAAWAQEEGPTPGGDTEAPAVTWAAEAAPVSTITEPCPAVIVRNTTLDQDCVGPISFGADKVQLNMAGHTVTCNSDPNAIGIAVVDRLKNRIVNGAVRDCGTGILLLRGGQHEIRNVELTDHDQAGPATRPPTGTANFGTGLELHGSDDNDVVNVSAARNRIGIFAFVGADRNRFVSPDISEGRPPFSAMEIQKSSENTVLSGRFRDASFEGVLITGIGNTVRSSEATGNTDGFGVGHPSSAVDTLLQGNRASGNRQSGIRLLAGARATTVTANRTSGNAQRGITVGGGSTQNVLTSNTAVDNGGFDLFDSNPACDSNSWLHNQFNTANQPCIQ